jgi:hypothetical protein
MFQSVTAKLTCSVEDLIHRDRVVGIATCYGMDDRGVGIRVPVGSRSFSTSSTQRHIQWVPVVKRPGRQADNSPPTNAEVEKMCIYTSTPPYAFMTATTLSYSNECASLLIGAQFHGQLNDCKLYKKDSS